MTREAAARGRMNTCPVCSITILEGVTHTCEPKPTAYFYLRSWLAVVFAVLTTARWISILQDGNYVWSAFVFQLISLPVSVGMLLFAILPSWDLYKRAREPRFRRSFVVSVCALAIVVVEVALLDFLPGRGE